MVGGGLRRISRGWHPVNGGHAILLPDGRYALSGTVSGEFWYAAGLCRFEPGELDP